MHPKIESIARVRGPRSIVNALTVDMEDWYHVCGVEKYADPRCWPELESRIARNTDRILSLFRAHGARATFFVLGYIAEREPALVRAVAAEGHEIASHGHVHRRIYDLGPDEFREDLERSLDALSAATGQAVVGFRAPEWSMRRHTMRALGTLRRNGILYDSSMVPLTRMGDRSFPSRPCTITTEHGDLREFPLTTIRCFGENLPFTGGLPLRLTPYFYILSRIRRMNRNGDAAMVYLHPWEFDTEQPRIELPGSRKFMHYFNLSSTQRKVHGLLARLRFASVRTVLGI
jgi:peptidoglycan-N-acetylglucosamine deacetylase